jgi:hypothetical protein
VIIDGGHNDWAWFDGPNTANSKGTSIPPPPPSPPTFDNSSPGGRRYPATWTDLGGNLWLFGGTGLDLQGAFSPPAIPMNDMWEYVGTQNYFGSYGNYWNNIIVFPAANPPSRDGAVSWTDPGTGNLLLFGGGDGGGFFNDIWSFSVSSKSWSSVNLGTGAAGVYGTQGTPAPGNIPGARWGATGRFNAATNTLWVFGGFGFDSTGTLGLLNDLWSYSGGQWTWVAGSNTVNTTGSYGTLGTPNGASNFPGGRQTAMCWLDNSGNFWLFGGYGLDSAGTPAALNDLWEYTAGAWTWMSGSTIVNQKGVYGTQMVAAATNVPGARWAAAAWTEPSNGALWLFGGQDFDNTGNGSLGDLWEYTGGQWIWTKGPNSASISGTYGSTTPGPVIYPYVGNFPGSRFAPAYWYNTVPTANGPEATFWMFGGEGFDAGSGNGTGLLSDLWRYLPYP